MAAAAVFKPLLLGEALLPHYYWKSSNDKNPSSKLELGIRMVVKCSNEAASDGWKVPKLCTATGTNSISKPGYRYSSCVLLSNKRPCFLSDSSCAGTGTDTGTGTGTPFVMSTVISGYWMGPDDDEECGDVQALVQRIN